MTRNASWIAGCNMPGYMPDSEPCAFETFDDARRAIIGDMEEAIGMTDEDWEGDSEAREFYIEDLNSAIARLKAATAAEYGETIGSWHYWITRA